MKKFNKILVCYNKPYINNKDYFENFLLNNLSSETEIIDNLNTITTYLSNLANNVYTLEVDKDILTVINKIKEINPDVCFNLVESLYGNNNYESNFAAVLELLNIPYTGNSFYALSTCLNKITTKQILFANKIPTPNFTHVKLLDSKIEAKELNFPLIVKPANEDAGIGISEKSIVNNDLELIKQVKILQQNFKQDLIIEEYIEGREFNISMLGNEILPISEINFNLPHSLPNIVTYQAKWEKESIYFKGTEPIVPAKINKDLETLLITTAKKSFEALQCKNYARVDIRLSKNNTPYVIDINPNPDIMPDSGFANSAKAAGIDYLELLNKILTFNNFLEEKND